jgi:hypothetical protein
MYSLCTDSDPAFTGKNKIRKRVKMPHVESLIVKLSVIFFIVEDNMLVS